MPSFRSVIGWVKWKAALAEIALIMIGILAALAVNQWWDARSKHATERAYLQQLLVDVDANQKAADKLIADHARALDAANRVVALFDAPGPLRDCEALVGQLGAALQWTSLPLRTGTYSALMATGDIRLIRDDQLRAQVVEYAGRADAAVAETAQNELEEWGSAKPFRGRVTAFWTTFTPQAPTGTSGASSTCALEPLRHAQDIREALFSTQLLHSNRSGAVQEFADVNARLRARIAAALDRSH